MEATLGNKHYSGSLLSHHEDHVEEGPLGGLHPLDAVACDDHGRVHVLAEDRL